jgi:transcriptional regulator with PAS, ATPase and Fis domain
VLRRGLAAETPRSKRRIVAAAGSADPAPRRGRRFVQFVAHAPLHIESGLGFTERRPADLTGPGSDSSKERHGPIVVTGVRLAQDFDRVMQFVRNRRDEPIRRHARLHFDPDVSLMAIVNHIRHARTEAPPGTEPELHDHDAIEWLHGENARLRADAAIEHDLIGESPAMRAVYRVIARAAGTDATVIVRGESGTGKELVARALHDNSARSHGPFVAINCAALPEALLESELFGHERGAFTGAVAQQKGRLEIAHRGTVFLDEIGELAPALQAKLLRVLQDQILERVGARKGIPIDVRVIAATNRDLETAIANGSFRQDLYFRIKVVTVVVPPLRERREDIPLLTAYFVRKHAARCKRSVKGVSRGARELLSRYDWPGNVRELSNAIERAVVLGTSETIEAEDLPEDLHSDTVEASARGFHARVAAAKRSMIREALDQNRGSVAAAARALDLQVTYLHRLIRNLGLRDGAPPAE